MRSRFATSRAEGPRTRHPAIVVAVLAAAGISVSLMQTLVIPLIPELPMLLHTNAANASWMITATLLTASVATPVFGRLGDMYGPKPILLLCAVILTVGSLIAATTSALLPVLIGRALQGFGIPIIPLGISVLRASVPPHRVGTAMGLMSSSLGVGGALGLPLSAIIADRFDWHALFWFAAALGIASGLLFAALVPRIPPTSTDRFDPLGALGLGVGLVTLLLGISKGGDWGWTSATTLGMFITSFVVFGLFGLWQFRTAAPIVDLRTTLKRPVLSTNVASIAVGFALFAMSLIGPQVLELPPATGYGLGQSMFQAGLWLAPGGLAMMVSAPIASRVAAARGPKFTLIVGSLIVSGSYLAGLVMIGSAWQVSVFNVLVSIGVGFAFASMPALINAAVPISETAAANGINALARSLGTSISSAVVGAVLAGMTISVAGQAYPTLTALRIALVIAAAMAALAALLAVLIPAGVGGVDESAAPMREPVTSRSGP
ncbi:MFS transporter [Mycolicibacterium sp. XJ879]